MADTTKKSDKEAEALEVEGWLNDLTVHIDDGAGYVLTLKGREIMNFFKDEADAWNQIVQDRNKTGGGSIPANLSQIRGFHSSRYSEIKAIVDSAPNQRLEQLTTQWNSVKQAIVVRSSKGYYSKSPYGIFLMSQYRMNMQRAEGSAKFFSGAQVNSTSVPEFHGYLDAYLFERGKDTDIASRPQAEIDAQTAARNSWEQMSHDISNVFDSLKTSMAEWKHEVTSAHSDWSKKATGAYDEFVSQKKTEMENVKRTYLEDVKLSGPARFWETRAKQYKTQGCRWLRGFIAATAVLGSFLALLLYFPADVLHAKIFDGDPIAVKGIILVAAILSLFAYVVRVFAKMTFSSYHLQRDAEERRQLTMVYLAMIREGAISEKERDVVLQSLFSRVDTGILSGDSSPTMPTINSLIDQLTAKKK